MNPLFTYLLKSTLWLIAFYAVYRFFLRKETFCNFNRFFLLLGLFTSIAMPFITIYHTIHVNIPVEDTLPIATTLTPIQTEQPVSSMEIFQTVISFVYSILIIVLGTRTGISLIPILKEIKTYSTGSRLIYTPTHQAPFSFGKYIFIPKNTSSDELDLILAHESTHTRQLHFIDLWLAKSICILQFFNPIAWFYSKAVQENCEFIADRQTLQSTTLTEEYFQLLLKYSVSRQLNPIALHFSFPLIFKRINIMKQKQSHKLASLKSLVVVPLASMIMVGFAQTKIIEDKATFSPKSEGTLLASVSKAKQSNKYIKAQSQSDSNQAVVSPAKSESQQQAKEDSKQANMQNEVVVVGYGASDSEPQTKHSDEVFTIAEEMPQFPDGNVQMYLAKNIRYPAEAQKNNIQGRVICQFIVETDGSISSVRVVRSVNPLLDAEACRVIYSMPKWIPGKQKGQIVRVKYTLPISFKLSK